MAKKIGKIILITIGSLLLILLTTGIIFKIAYSQDKIEPFEINAVGSAKKILIATQGSEFKDGIVKEIIGHPNIASCYIKGINTSNITKVDSTQWDVIVVINTIEGGKIEKKVANFLNDNKQAINIVTLITSGDGHVIPKDLEVDALTSSSKKENISHIAGTIIKEIEGIIKS